MKTSITFRTIVVVVALVITLLANNSLQQQQQAPVAPPSAPQSPLKNSTVSQISTMVNYLLASFEPLNNKKSIEDYMNGSNKALKIVKDTPDCKKSLLQIGDSLFEFMTTF